MEAANLQRVRNTLVYQELIAWHVKQALMKGAKAVEGYAKLTVKVFFAPDKKGKLPEDRGDLDNLLKSITDGLQYGGAFAPKKGCKKGNDKAVVRFGDGTGIYIGKEDYVEITLEELEEESKVGRKKYDWSDEELKRLKDTYERHGWKMGYYMNFGCSYMTCYRKLIELGLLSDKEEGLN